METRWEGGDRSNMSSSDATTLEALLESADVDTETVVDRLRESGPRRHVSEENVDDVLAEISTPADDETAGGFGLSGGPTTTVSTTGIDEVFDQLERDARAEKSGSAHETVESTSASDDRYVGTLDSDRDHDFERVEREVESEFGSLAGGGPTRTVSERGVDEILALVDEEPGETLEPEHESPTDALLPDDPDEAMATLVSDASVPAAGETSEPEDTPTDDEGDDDNRSEPTASTFFGSDGTVDLTDAFESHRSGRDDPESTTVEPARPPEPVREPVVEPTDTSDPTDIPASTDTAESTDRREPMPAPRTTRSSRPLVTREELEAIAALAPPHRHDDSVGDDELAESAETPSASETGPSVTVDDVLSPTDVATRFGPVDTPRAESDSDPLASDESAQSPAENDQRDGESVSVLGRLRERLTAITGFVRRE
ncbi:hypothetical protein [Halovivax gelatinilyticus]|uniref:hypothetical protein n=1 Tax=Halovivax gelatinilyticus TaxID=2961597 RepID=UPI0020CA8887|nr:hypothetical protein [Halovivax gelatinilyticus]